jgi:hypothetical protein
MLVEVVLHRHEHCVTELAVVDFIEGSVFAVILTEFVENIFAYCFCHLLSHLWREEVVVENIFYTLLNIEQIDRIHNLKFLRVNE